MGWSPSPQPRTRARTRIRAGAPRARWAGARSLSPRSVAGRFQGSSAWSLMQLSVPLALTQPLAACAFLQRNLSGASHPRMENASLGAPLNRGGPLPLMCLGSAINGGRERMRPSFTVPRPCPSIHWGAFLFVVTSAFKLICSESKTQA